MYPPWCIYGGPRPPWGARIPPPGCQNTSSQGAKWSENGVFTLQGAKMVRKRCFYPPRVPNDHFLASGCQMVHLASDGCIWPQMVHLASDGCIWPLNGAFASRSRNWCILPLENGCILPLENGAFATREWCILPLNLV